MPAGSGQVQLYPEVECNFLSMVIVIGCDNLNGRIEEKLVESLYCYTYSEWMISM